MVDGTHQHLALGENPLFKPPPNYQAVVKKEGKKLGKRMNIISVYCPHKVVVNVF